MFTNSLRLDWKCGCLQKYICQKEKKVKQVSKDFLFVYRMQFWGFLPSIAIADWVHDFWNFVRRPICLVVTTSFKKLNFST